MGRLLAILLALHLLVCASAQERHAVVRLDDGSELTGVVVAMDLEQLQLRTESGVVTIPSVRMVKCTYLAKPAQAAQAEVGAAAERAPVATPPVSSSTETPDQAAGKTAGQSPPPSRAPQGPPANPPKTVPRTVQELPLEEAERPVDLRRRSRLKERLESLDERYAWLVPAAPAQWISLGLSLFACLALAIHTATRLTSGEQPDFARCMFLSAWYLVTGFLQFALAPGFDLAVAIMLLANSALALFWLRALFGLTRGNAILAFAIQLGFLLIGYGVLELADSILASVQHQA